MAKIGFIGMGNMGTAIMRGLLKTYKPEELLFTSAHEAKMQKITEETGVAHVSTATDCAEQVKYLVLAVKPQVLPTVFKELNGKIRKDQVVISIAAGYAIADLQAGLGDSARIVRSMPNTPAMVGEGMSGVSYDEALFTDEEKDVIDGFFTSFGKMEKVDEKLMDVVGSASGCSPAYVYMFIEALADGCVKNGLPRQAAYKMVAQAVLGSAKMVLETGKHPGELKDMVCSPAGTTIKAVRVLEKEGLRIFGPRANAAIIEGSKAFSKELMRKYNIPTAEYKVFDNAEEAIDYIKERNEFPTVIKADGLALGKGVIIPENLDDAIAGVKEIMEDKIFGASGNNIVVEEFLTGPEVSVLAFTDGKCVKPMVSSMDHKRALDGDKGLNTGGMGTVSPNPYYTQDVAKECMDKIFIPTINAMNNEGRTFKGCLYFGLMITPKGPKVIEYNCRFGDPETQVVLPRLKTDIVDIFEAIDNETLSDLDVEWSDDACACVIMASGGYPKSYPKGIEITGLSNGQLDGVTVYHAGTKLQDNKLVTSGGRVLGVTALGDTLENALKKSYDAVEKIHFEGAHYRRDIGKRALEANK